ncbi:MAG: LacI family DNA-binding transcriptional regulator [Anaerolineales bacterium]|nr:LacI family DNA-binding transcriptional regulator [Anaerolineales bacterium]
MAEKITIEMVAKECDVSLTTVSLVLNNKPGVSTRTRTRVLETARRLGYTPAPKVPPGKTMLQKTLGMLVKTEPELATPANPFYSQIVAGVDQACTDLGISFLFSLLPVDENNHPVKVPPLLENTMVVGLLMVGAFVDQTIVTLLGEHPPPIVLVDGYSDTERYDMVVSDNFRAAYQAIEHLLGLGHRQIGLVGSEPDCYPSLLERRHGYQRALKENGALRPYLADFNVNRSQGEAETRCMLQENPQITALFCVNDNVALGAMRAAQSLGRRIPQNLSVIGYDNTYLANNANPPLTSMHVDTLAMGRAAAHLVSMRMEQPGAARTTVVIHPTLVERGSTSRLT